MQTGSRVVAAFALLVAGCVPGEPLPDVALPDGAAPDGATDAGPSMDSGIDGAAGPEAGLDGAVVALDASVDAPPIDAGASRDGAPDASACGCPPAGECETARCEAGACIVEIAIDGAPCGSGGTDLCVAGSCTPRGCGDGHRERGPAPPREGCDDGNAVSGDACSPGCVPDVLVVSSRPYTEDLPTGASVAADGHGALLFAWHAEEGGSSWVRAQRASAVGVLVGAPIDLRSGPWAGWDASPVVAGLSGGDWIVAWSDPSGDSDQSGIVFSIIRDDGTFSPPRVANVERRGPQYEPAIATEGAGFVLAWTDGSGFVTGLGASRVVTRSFDSTGAAITMEAALSDASSSAREPALASDGTAVLAAWTDEPFGPTGAPRLVALRIGVDIAPFELSANGSDPAVMVLADGSFAAAWVDRTADHLGDVASRVIAPTGDPLTGSSTVSVAAIDGRPELSPSIAPRGSEYVVAYEDGGTRRGVAFARVGAAALAPEASDLATYLVAGLQGDVSLLATPRGLWFAWSDDGALGDPLAYRSLVAFLLPTD